MKTELLEKLINKLIDGDDEGSEGKELIGEFVIVRCRNAGVHAGTLKSYKGQEVVLKDSRRLWYWKAANKTHTLSGVAKEGITSESKIPPSVGNIVLMDACEIIQASPKCRDSILEAPSYESN